MKTLSKLGILCALGGSLLFTSCAGDYYVTDRPVEPVYVRPVSPYANAYWVPGEWVWRGGRYSYVNDYYARPRPGRVYVSGGWVRGNRGYAWRRGHWR